MLQDEANAEVDAICSLSMHRVTNLITSHPVNKSMLGADPGADPSVLGLRPPSAWRRWATQKSRCKGLEYSPARAEWTLSILDSSGPSPRILRRIGGGQKYWGLFFNLPA